jgi:hypothetical protein
VAKQHLQNFLADAGIADMAMLERNDILLWSIRRDRPLHVVNRSDRIFIFTARAGESDVVLSRQEEED